MFITKKEQYYYISLSGLDKIKEEVANAYDEAFQKGYSVIELTRISGVKSARFVHSILVKRGKIPKTKPGREVKVSVPEGLLPSLNTRGLTFTLWCAGWYFDPQEAGQEITEMRGRAFDAVKRDFPAYYEKVTRTKISILDNIGEPPSEEEKDRFVTEHDKNSSCFKTYITKSGRAGYGKTPIDAMKTFLRINSSLKTIKKLNELPNILGW